MAGLFERHDRSQFELIAFSFGHPHKDAMRDRVEAAFDRFIDVSELSDQGVAALSREAGVDVAVDLKGFTAHSRPGIFAYRAAPIQVNYLGFPATMGCEYIDYVIADETLIRPDEHTHYSEKVVCLPDCYQVNDDTKFIAPTTASREEHGLPSHGFVFCCFNSSYKITPDVFDIWMRLLERVPGSALWLFRTNDDAAKALQAEAVARGIDPARLVWAHRMGLAEHLARHRHADLFQSSTRSTTTRTLRGVMRFGLDCRF
jgi:predicted O-linked N-acetylglucosamine transferase (SPINDLY family)